MSEGAGHLLLHLLPSPRYKSKIKTSDSILSEHVVESRKLQDKVETLLSEQDTSRDSRNIYVYKLYVKKGNEIYKVNNYIAGLTEI